MTRPGQFTLSQMFAWTAWAGVGCYVVRSELPQMAGWWPLLLVLNPFPILCCLAIACGRWRWAWACWQVGWLISFWLLVRAAQGPWCLYGVTNEEYVRLPLLSGAYGWLCAISLSGLPLIFALFRSPARTTVVWTRGDLWLAMGVLICGWNATCWCWMEFCLRLTRV